MSTTLPQIGSFTPATILSLKSNPAFDESWVEKVIIDNPSLLGLGDLTNIINQVTQRHAGRLDLRADDAKNKQRYVIELMLGEFDGDHLVRLFDYWLRRSKQDAETDWHVVAVLAAERVSLSRYYGVLQFLAENLASVMPLIVLETTAIQLGGHTSLLFKRVVDSELLRFSEDESETSNTRIDKSYWSEGTAEDIVALLDRVFALLRKINPNISPNYQTQYIGTTVDNRNKNFCTFYPQKKALQVVVKSPNEPESWKQRLSEEANIVASSNEDEITFKLKTEDFEKVSPLLLKLFAEAYNSRFGGTTNVLVAP